jgi:acyl-CoA synthetase (AMP-forming)/AMP-acid ligase II
MNLYALLDQSAARWPSRPAAFLGDRLVLTYAQLRSRALQIAASLRKDFKTGDRIAIVTENRPEYVELFFGVWAASMVATPVNAKLHPREFLQILEDSGAVAAFVSPKLAEGLALALTDSMARDCRRIVIGSADYATLFGEEWAGPIESAPEALAWLFYTSGTTGRSKGAMLSHRNLMAMTIAHLADIETIDENCSLIHAAPMSHGSGLYICAYVARGASHVTPASAGFDAAEFLDLCDLHPSCGAFLAPTMLQRLRLEAERTGRRPSNLRAIVYGGGPMYVEELRKSLTVFGQVFVQIYGQGESPMTITGLRRADHETGDDAVLGSVGVARSGVEVAIVSASGERAQPGEIGEIVCRGDVVMSGYWRNAPATTDALKGGWLYTGDVGSFDERGYLTLRDRSKDVVISGGSNIYPREVEEVLLKHPAVGEACVVGEPNSEWGEIVVAFVVPKQGASIDTQSLDALCNDHVARFKRPKRYIFTDDLPKNNYGKVLKRELRARLLPLEGAPSPTPTAKFGERT